MKSELLPIGKMAAMNHVSVATLRLYDRLGLLHPRYTDEATGYRYYDLQQNARLDMIAYMKELGMSLAEIADVLSQEDVTRIEEILARKNEQIHEQIRELRARHDAVERAIASIERYRKSPATGTFSLEYIDRRRIWGIACSGNFYEAGLHSYEADLARLRLSLADHGFRQVHSYNVGTTIRQESFEAQRFEPAQVFAFLGSRDTAPADAAILDSGMYACIYLDGFDEEVAYAGRLLDSCRKNGYRICGDYICEVLTEFNVFDSETRSMFLRLQVPVRFDKNFT